MCLKAGRGPSQLVVVLFALMVATERGHAWAQASDLPPELGYNYADLETPRAAAMGGALRALANSTDALFANPANIATTRVYHLAGLVQIWPQSDRQSYGGAAVDSVVSASRLAGGLSGTWVVQDDQGVDRQGWDLRGALALPFSSQFYAGGAVRYLSLREDGFARDGSALPPSPASAGLREEAIVQDLAFDAGLTVKPSANFALSLVGTNLNDPGHPLLPLTLGGGIGIGTEQFSLEGDWVSDFTTYATARGRLGLGAEVVVARDYPLRAGYKYDQGLRNHALSIGAGYVSRELSAEIALRRGVEGDRFTAIFLALQYHLEAAGLGAIPVR